MLWDGNHFCHGSVVTVSIKSLYCTNENRKKRNIYMGTCLVRLHKKRKEKKKEMHIAQPFSDADHTISH